MDTELSRALTRNEVLALDKLRLKWRELSVEVRLAVFLVELGLGKTG